MPVQRQFTVASSGDQPFNTGQCFLLAEVCPQSTSWHRSNTSTMLWTIAGLMLARRLWRWPTFSVVPNMTRLPNTGLMLDQRRRQWANISLTLGQRLVFDRMQDRKHWSEMNWRQTQTETDWAGRGKAICPHLCLQRGDIITHLVSRSQLVYLWEYYKGNFVHLLWQLSCYGYVRNNCIGGLHLPST